MATKPPAPQPLAVSSIPIADDSDPSNPKVASSALDFLLIELVPLAQRMAERVAERERALTDELRRSKIFANSGAVVQQQQQQQQSGSGGKESEGTGRRDSGSTAAAGGVAGAGWEGKDGEETREAVLWRLDGLGYRVGQGLVERFSANKSRTQSALDAIKFVCKDIWQLVFRKQIDNLKTNHRGIFVLTDQKFPPLSRMSVDRLAGPKAEEEAITRAQLYLYFPAGIIRGALSGLGVEATVSPESTEIPTATFQIKTKGAKA